MDLAEAALQDRRSGSRHPWERARVKLVCNLVARTVRLREGSTVLDIGCGDTFVINQFASTYPGARCYGVDAAFTQDTIRQYQQQSNATNVRLVQSLDDLEGELAREVTLVLLMDVLEHVEHEATLLHDLLRRPYIGPETWFLVTVPAHQWLFSAHDRFLGHYRRYSRLSATQRLEAAGLSPLHSRYFFASLLPVRALQVLLERLGWLRGADERTGVAGWRGGTVLGNALTTLLLLDERLGRVSAAIGISLPGLSVLALCRKSA